MRDVGHASHRMDALFLDLDGTLVWVDSAAAVRATCVVLSDRFGVDPGVLARANARVFRPYFAAMERDWALGRLDDKALSREVWRRALAELDCRDDAAIDLAVRSFTEACQANLGQYDDVPGFLDSIPNSVPVGVITNGPADAQSEKLQVVGLIDRFDVIITSADAGVLKPDRLIFSQALARLGVEGASAWHVGDSLVADVGGANAAGLVSVWINRQRHNSTPVDPIATHEVTTLAAVPALWSRSR